MLKLVSGLHPVQKGSAEGRNDEDKKEEEQGAAARGQVGCHPLMCSFIEACAA